MLLHVSIGKEEIAYQVRVVWGSLIVTNKFAFKHSAEYQQCLESECIFDRPNDFCAAKQ